MEKSKKYRVNEIFYSLQGEGTWTGVAATFIRFAGCNLKCPFCDTDFREYQEMTADDIVRETKQYQSPMVVVTGGEPALQLDTALVDQLHRAGKRVHVETNGTVDVHQDVLQKVDWWTCSPKTEYFEDATVRLRYLNELKVVYTGQDISRWDHYDCLKFLQPCDTGDKLQNKVITEKAVLYVKEHPQWRLSLQTQKVLAIR